ncbi:hypothetical protein ACTG16_23785 [Aeromonas sp. 23P]|uniref:hypothetical protein n=1 Tax=Aeromonas sp. 23P TaxID=3452716 RepID=UPI003F794521|nr:hypothetical protein [Aeromonas veronii]
MQNQKEKEVARTLKNYLLSSEASSLGGLEMGFHILAEKLQDSDYGIDLHKTFARRDIGREQVIKSFEIVFFSGKKSHEKDFFIAYNPNFLERREVGNVKSSSEDETVMAPMLNVIKFSGKRDTFTSSSELVERHKAFWSSVGKNYKAEVRSEEETRRRSEEAKRKRQQMILKERSEALKVQSLIKNTVSTFNSANKVEKVVNKYFVERGMEDIVQFMDLRVADVESNGSVKQQYLVPLYDINFQVKNFQMLDPSGKKNFPKGVPVAGLFSLLGDPDKTTGPIIFAEGLSTLWSSKKFTQHWTLDEDGKVVEMDTTEYVPGKSPVYVFCLNSAGMTAAISIFNQLYPNRLKISMSDNDCHKIHSYNAGQYAALNAGYESGAVNCKPVFKQSDCQQYCPEDRPNDWHSFLSLYGLEESRKQAFASLDYDNSKLKYGDLLLKLMENSGCSDAWKSASKIMLPAGQKTDPKTFIYGLALIQKGLPERAFFSRDTGKDTQATTVKGDKIAMRAFKDERLSDDGSPLLTIKDIPVDTLIHMLAKKDSAASTLRGLDFNSKTFIEKYVVPFVEDNYAKIAETLKEEGRLDKKIDQMVNNLNERSICLIVEDREIKESLLLNDRRKVDIKALADADFISGKSLASGETIRFTTIRYDIHEAHTRFFAEAITKQVNDNSVIVKDVLDSSIDADGRRFKVDVLAKTPVVTKVDWVVTNKGDESRSIVDIIQSKDPDCVTTNAVFKKKVNKDCFIERMMVNGKEMNLDKILLSDTFCARVEKLIDENVKRGRFNSTGKEVIYVDHRPENTKEKNLRLQAERKLKSTAELSKG